jgi:hypothetical protein
MITREKLFVSLLAHISLWVIPVPDTKGGGSADPPPKTPSDILLMLWNWW